MKSVFTKVNVLFATIAILILSGCAHNGSLTRCPDMGAKHKPVYAKAYHPKTKSKATKKRENNTEQAEATQPKRSNQFIAFMSGKTPLNVELPTSFTSKMEEGEFEKANAVFMSNSNNKVSLVKNSEGKITLHADSRKDLRKAVKKIAFERPKTAVSGETADILALVGGILGIVSAGTSPIPFVNFLSIFVGVGAIVLGVLGWKSERRKVWSRLGVILGAIGISLAILFIILYFVVLQLWWF